jgi:6-phosphogluconolactonase
MTKRNDGDMLVYVGTHTRGKSEGIYVYRMGKSTGAMEFASVTGGVENPSFLAIHPQKRHLYAVSEVGNVAGKPGGGASAFSIDPETGGLTYLNQQSSKGAGSCHLSVDQTGRFVLVANYGSGSVAVLPIESDGTLGEATDFVQHEGSSIDTRRQSGPHAHSIMLDNANRYVFVPDLGLDKIMIYLLDLTQGKLEPNDEPWAKVKAGAGPRHFAFHPSGRYAYVINELDSTLTAFNYDGEQGRLKEIQTVPTLPDDFSDTSHCADVHISPSGRFIYGSNRGHDSIVIFEIDEATGRLTYADHEPTQGKTPRNFAIDPTGNFLLAANQNTDNIVIFRIDQQTGKLTATGHTVEVPTPVCLKMVCLPL